MIYSVVVGREVYVYYNGQLLYKKWLDTDQPSKIFDKGGLPPFELR